MAEIRRMAEMLSKEGKILEMSIYSFEKEEQIHRQALVRTFNTQTQVFPNPIISYKFALQWEMYERKQKISELPGDTGD
jgi:hypothetical protein